MKIRIFRPRKEFGLDDHSFIEREAAGDSSTEIKITKTGYFTKKKVLEIGLQAANQMKRFCASDIKCGELSLYIWINYN